MLPRMKELILQSRIGTHMLLRMKEWIIWHLRIRMPSLLLYYSLI
uniref:Uncharacterized protein n=1 Tax=Picea sitchensis TaxID=3332 RepID=A0A6B9XV49_PICSI|nr:hypothetical protein Q903MT_gene4035 [Picea sitchensis]